MDGMNPEQIAEIRVEAETLAVRLGCEIVEVSVRGKGTASVVQIFADRPGGISIDECSTMHRDVSAWIDLRHPEWRGCRLEVSSPGLDRPLKTVRDFERNAGRPINAEWTEEGKTLHCVGTVRSASEESIDLEVEGRLRRIPLAALVRAKIHLPW